MKLKLKNTPEQVELVKAMGSKDLSTSREAQEAFAAFLGPVVQQVINQAGTAGAIFTDAPFDEDDSPSYPLDLYYNNSDNHISVWMQSMAGGLPSSHVEGMNELKIATYRLDSAVNFLKRYVRRARLDVVSKGVERMAQELLVKQERNAWAVILKALAEASTGGADHIIQTSSRTNFMLSDLNDLMTLVRRINESWAGGTPDVASSGGLTDLYMSPERMADVRALAYNPVNTVGANNIAPANSSGVIAMPDGVREDIYRAAGASELFGVTLNEMNEFGIGKKYNVLFGGLDSISFGNSTDDLIVGLDNSKGAFIRPVAMNAEGGSSVVTLADDQWSARSEKLGFYSMLEEGRVCIDSRAIVGLSLEA
jgi:hypothetical protein